MASQAKNRYQVIRGRPLAIQKQPRMPRGAMTHAKGMRNFRGASGRRCRRMSTATQTMTKANRVPMLASSTTSSMLSSAAGMATRKPVSTVAWEGVLNFSCTLPNQGASRPSRLMLMKIRGWPTWYTSNAAVVAMTAPKLMTAARPFILCSVKM